MLYYRLYISRCTKYQLSNERYIFIKYFGNYDQYYKIMKNIELLFYRFDSINMAYKL